MYESSVKEVTQIVNQDIPSKYKHILIKDIVYDVEFIRTYKFLSYFYNNLKISILITIMILLLLGALLSFFIHKAYEILKITRMVSYPYLILIMLSFCLIVVVFAGAFAATILGRQVTNKMKKIEKVL